VLSNIVAKPVVAQNGTVVKRGLADSGLRVLSRIFQESKVPAIGSTCTYERDPNGALAVVLKNMVTPMGDKQQAPIQVIMDVIGDVNRADPTQTSKFMPADYANVANEVSEFALDPSRGLEQFYAVIKQATGE
jgi:hypothetical protein